MSTPALNDASPTGTHAVPLTETPEQARRRQRRMALAAVVGTAVEWYDFYLYAAMASIVFATVFFPEGDSKFAALQSLATFAVGFLARPVGGVVFGALGDRIGRKRTLVVTFILMGVSTGVIGFLPDFATIGMWAPIALVLLRILQGLGAGAEFASAAVASYEHADVAKRGSMGSWPTLGMNLGLVLSAATVFVISLLGDDFLTTVGWRIPFVASFALVAVGLWIRASVPETPDFAQESEQRRTKAFPLIALLRQDWRGLAVVIGIALGCTSISYIFKTFSLAYLTQFKGVSAADSALGVTLAGIAAVLVIPLLGRLCDRWSSKRVLIVGGVLSGVWATFFLALLNTGETWAIWTALIVGTGVLVPTMMAAQGSFYSRQFPVATRASGVGTAREFGTSVAGGAAPLGALALVTASPTHSTVGVGVVLVGAAVLAVVPAMFDQGTKHSAYKN
ncbi:MFS transporter [Mycolicibacterium smegmatis]|uniref:Major facilitator superfamily MFS-1 n=3 Tax=Mycolicibacterium smegmatis TaxID=1772 RepID=I7FA42_MYCS2|nr:MFS transporter [Mycolicibacterium smegmatis]ABK75897.1 major facilitator family protein transporter [Mycolicibacterium smegmatis MC2 155]AFP38410.1 Major facilitator superfamily MFS-1 [Mycolicibacterium smegmatis MC2 155]AIU07200.1 MFS transporter [Mycolicibacterium smegmatis MC2 155]AIU13825.1 MFS transporter [Mycolicibacterium smegmatis]AIU20449.1 MFS transporter [Mycolicibacterium smegmatis]